MYFPKVSFSTEKMAGAKMGTAIAYSTYCKGHSPSEIIDVDRFRFMCSAHVPVYLFRTAQSEELLNYHVVSIR